MYIKGYVSIAPLALQLLQAHGVNPTYVRSIPGYDSFEIPDNLSKYFDYKAGNIVTCGVVNLNYSAIVAQGLKVKLKQSL